MSDNNTNTEPTPEPCSVCNGTGKPAPGMVKCICMGTGTRKSEVDNLRALSEALRDTFYQLQVRLNVWGYHVTKPSDLLPALEKLYERCIDAEDEYVKMKRERIK